jgi:hypothetical protein
MLPFLYTAIGNVRLEPDKNLHLFPTQFGKDKGKKNTGSFFLAILP